MIASFIGFGAASALAGAVIYANLPTRLTIGAVGPTIAFLNQAPLKKIDSEKDVATAETVQASELWSRGPALVMAVRRPGCLLCRREAAQLSTLKPELDKAGIKLFGVVHETRGVDEFKPYLKGDVYFDEEKRFYGPNQRWLPIWMGFLRVGTYMNVYKARKGGFDGNYKGEGRLLGGVYLINKGEIAFTHLEKEWGDAANVSDVLNAVRKLQD